MAIPTVAELRRKHRRLDRRRASAATVMARLQRGASLNLSFERGLRRWCLSDDGTSIPEAVAKIIIADHRVVGVGDALFRNLPSQTYRYAE
jgi:hypothetical protein